jgi:hypothetical protein
MKQRIKKKGRPLTHDQWIEITARLYSGARIHRMLPFDWPRGMHTEMHTESTSKGGHIVAFPNLQPKEFGPCPNCTPNSVTLNPK